MPLRILAGLALWWFLGIMMSSLLGTVVTGRSPLFELRGTPFGSIAVNAIDLLVGAISTPVAIYLTGRYVDRRRFRDFGLRVDRAWWTDLAFGFALGGALMTAIFLIQLALGWITIRGVFVVGGVPQWTFPYWFLLSVAAYLVGSVIEELLHRGFLLTNFAEGFQVGPVGARGAVAIGIAVTSGVFAFAHATAPNATAISTASIALAGVFLGLGYVLTGELALPIGVHIAWNFFEGNLYGFPISGSTTTSILAIDQHGPDIVTGGTFGPEAGLLGVGAILLGILATIAWVRYYRGYSGIHPAVTNRDDLPK
jgi:hypothetical protein